MRIMALDIGKKRTGIAISDADGKIASPVCVLPSNEVFSCAQSFTRLLEDYEPELMVAGLPVSMDGQENDHAMWIRIKASELSDQTGIPLEFQDERLSSAEAKRIMHEEGMSEREMRGKLDMVAASVFLQTYLDGESA